MYKKQTKSTATPQTPTRAPRTPTVGIHVDDHHDARTRTRAHALDASVRANDGQERGEPEFDDVFGVGFASRKRRFDDNHGGVSTPVRDE